MYDYLICEHPLPVGSFSAKMEDPPDWSEFEFQTFSLRRLEDFSDNYEVLFPCKYSISEDGLLYRESTEEGVERQDFTGEIKFYGQHLEAEKDFIMEFLALFWKGELKEINLTSHESVDNTKRKEAQKTFSEVVKKATQKKDKWWYKIYLFYRKSIGLFFSIIRYLFESLINLTIRIERWIT